MKPRLIYDTHPLTTVCGRVVFYMDTVTRVALVESEGYFKGSLDVSSGFHHVLLHPASWPLLGRRYQGVDYVRTVLPFGWCESPYVYHTLSEANEALLQSKGIPALPYIDGSWLANMQSTYGQHKWEPKPGSVGFWQLAVGWYARYCMLFSLHATLWGRIRFCLVVPVGFDF